MPKIKNKFLIWCNKKTYCPAQAGPYSTALADWGLIKCDKNCKFLKKQYKNKGENK